MNTIILTILRDGDQFMGSWKTEMTDEEVEKLIKTLEGQMTIIDPNGNSGENFNLRGD